jgi:hypothetical protein
MVSKRTKTRKQRKTTSATLTPVQPKRTNQTFKALVLLLVLGVVGVFVYKFFIDRGTSVPSTASAAGTGTQAPDNVLTWVLIIGGIIGVIIIGSVLLQVVLKWFGRGSGSEASVDNRTIEHLVELHDGYIKAIDDAKEGINLDVIQEQLGKVKFDILGRIDTAKEGVYAKADDDHRAMVDDLDRDTYEYEQG